MSPSSQPVIHESFTVIGGTRTRVLEVEGEGPPFLLIHGFSDSADTWRWVMEHLGAAGRRAVAVDLPGHGRAESADRPLLPFLDRFTTAFIEAYASDEGAIVAGNSLGGMLALRAASHAELSLVAAVGVCPGGLAHRRRLEVMARLIVRFKPVFQALSYVPVPTGLIQQAMTRFYSTRLMPGVGDLTPALHYAGHFRDYMDIRRVVETLGLITLEVGPGPVTAGSPSARATIPLESIAAPVLLVWGLQDELTDPRGADPVLEVVPDSRLVVFDESGHCPQLQEPGRLADLLLRLPESLRDDSLLDDTLLEARDVG